MCEIGAPVTNAFAEKLYAESAVNVAVWLVRAGKLTVLAVATLRVPVTVVNAGKLIAAAGLTREPLIAVKPSKWPSEPAPLFVRVPYQQF